VERIDVRDEVAVKMEAEKGGGGGGGISTGERAGSWEAGMDGDGEGGRGGEA
jgi:hypothetical protein